MSRLELEKKWNRIKKSVKLKYINWFQNDQDFSDGNLSNYIAKMKAKTGRTKNNIEQEIKDWREDENHL